MHMIKLLLVLSGWVNWTDARGGTAIVACLPTSTADVVSADWTKFGSTIFSSHTYTENPGTGWLVYTLNASGLAYISKTGITSFGFMLRCDADNDPLLPGSGGSSMLMRQLFYVSESTPPKLEITYYFDKGLRYRKGVTTKKVVVDTDSSSYQVKIRIGGVTYGIPLVDPINPLASDLRFRVKGVTKAAILIPD